MVKAYVYLVVNLSFSVSTVYMRCGGEGNGEGSGRGTCALDGSVALWWGNQESMEGEGRGRGNACGGDTKIALGILR